MPTLQELTTKIVSSHALKSPMSSEQVLQEIGQVYDLLKMLDEGNAPEHPSAEPSIQALTIRQAFKKDEVICMVCGKGGFKTLKKHLGTAHQLTPGQYRKQFGIKSSQKLAAKSFSESRSQAALDRGMVDMLAKARETRMANIKAKKNSPAVKSKAPAVKTKSTVPVAKKKAPVSARTKE